ncbi:MAG: LuxR family transcriptional regulator [Microcystis aeruginosa L211-101]|nr:LuxR family transcriptional regulator [Microcystis aeruginosa L211-11]NCR30675.1 LuxR family transcriptional regulator [Microcystis aeruginosa L211-101]
MSRSLKINPEYIPKAELALKQKRYTNKSTFAELIPLARATVTKFFKGKPISHENFMTICEKLGLNWQEIALLEENFGEGEIDRKDWGGVTEADFFCGRTEELAEIKRWIIGDKCRLITVFGMAGMGKTALAVELAQGIEGDFDYLIYRSLKQVSPLTELLGDWLEILTNSPRRELPDSIDIRLARLIDRMTYHRCLLLLDDGEEILQSDNLSGRYREEFQDYEKLLRRMGEAPHKSCLVLMSREKPKDIDFLEKRQNTVKSLFLGGLDELSAREMVNKEGGQGTEREIRDFIELYRGNPFFLKLALARIVDIFGGNIAEFLQTGTINFSDIKEMIEVQWQRLSEIEREILEVLAREEEAISVSELRSRFDKPGLTDAVDSLRKRSFIESRDSGFILPNLIQSYVRGL